MEISKCEAEKEVMKEKSVWIMKTLGCKETALV